MPVALWRCENDECDEKSRVFEAEENRCPHCKMPWCLQLVPAHYLVPAEGPIRTSLGNRMIACDPNMRALPESATGLRQCVTCPKCRASQIFTEDERDGISNDVTFLARITSSGATQKR